MLKSSYRIATVWGIPIKAHITLPIVILAAAARTRDFLITPLLMILAYVCIALHELGHSYVAMKKGCRVREILLFFLGGVAQMTSIPKRPRDEFLMAIAGPAVSFSLFLILSGIGFLNPWTIARIDRWPYRIDAFHPLALLNLGWTIFNLIPAFPMDGGRVLRAALSHRIGRLRATFAAATVGKVVAVIFCLVGLNGRHPFLVLIGILVYVLAGREYRAVEMQEKARMFGFGFRGFEPQDPDIRETEDGEVIIGPPPYERGPGSKTAVRPVNERPDNLW